jgi:predicted nucleic-acid-binding protein
MIALDTNVLVRFLVEDDPDQAERAASLVERAERSGEPLLLTQVVACETVWVLDTAYGFRREEISGVLQEVFRARQILLEDEDSLRRALDAYRGGEGDFADCLIRERARAAGAEAVATFDRVLLEEPGFIEP